MEVRRKKGITPVGKNMLIAVGCCAGGFTQAPNTAESIKERLDDISL